MKNTMLEGSTSKALVSMSVPISIGMLSTFLFQVIDTYFVGQLGAEALAALSFSSTLYFLLVGLFIGFSVGVSILIGKAKGEGDTGRIQRTLGVGMVLSFLLTLVLAWVLVTNWRPIFSGLGAQTDTLPLISEYIKPLLLGMPLLTVGLLVSGGLRATGN
ncbi:MAG TPA: MATE family efflux transporter, partial [Cytophagales bacterium]|nr:MATE family efflux transporter [Cytophagales bacterium]